MQAGANRYLGIVLEPSEAIDRINRVYGAHPKHRALHARGTFYEGTFTASAEATALTTAEAFSGAPTPLVVRWSNGSGNPRHPDKAPDVRGMAVSFRAPGGAFDLLGQTSPRFPVRTPEDFLLLTEASQRQALLPLFMARRPNAIPALLASVRAKSVVPPYSYAEATYFPIHAYAWTNAAGQRSWVRFVLAPVAGRDERPAGTFEGRERLTDEIVARLAEHPARYDLRVTVAAAGDDPHDPMSVWDGERELSGGIIEVTGPTEDPEHDGNVVVFDPTRTVPGIELSDDPILRYRALAYSESITRRQA
jgi:catalase